MKIKKIHEFLICHCFDENKSIFFGNSEKVGMFAATIIHKGKRKPANLQAFFMLVSTLYI